MIDMLNLLWVLTFLLVLAVYNGHLLVTSIRGEEWFTKMGTRKKVVYCIVSILRQQSDIKNCFIMDSSSNYSRKIFCPYRDTSISRSARSGVAIPGSGRV